MRLGGIRQVVLSKRWYGLLRNEDRERRDQIARRSSKRSWLSHAASHRQGSGVGWRIDPGRGHLQRTTTRGDLQYRSFSLADRLDRKAHQDRSRNLEEPFHGYEFTGLCGGFLESKLETRGCSRPGRGRRHGIFTFRAACAGLGCFRRGLGSAARVCRHHESVQDQRQRHSLRGCGPVHGGRGHGRRDRRRDRQHHPDGVFKRGNPRHHGRRHLSRVSRQRSQEDADRSRRGHG